MVSPADRSGGPRISLGDLVIGALVGAAVCGGVIYFANPSGAALAPTQVQSQFRSCTPACDSVSRLLHFPASMGPAYQRLLEYQAVLEKAAPRDAVMGHILWFPWQTWYYAAHAAEPCIKTICEVGFGAGYSTVLYMAVNTNATIVTFDIFNLGPYQDAGRAWLESQPQENARWRTVKGMSQETVPQFAAQNPGFLCDLVHVDGDHGSPAPYTDLKNLKPMSHKDTVVLIDDANEGDTQKDMQRAVDAGITEAWECMEARDETDKRFTTTEAYHKRFCQTRYVIR